MLRKVREEKGVEYAIEYAGHVSESTFGDTRCPPNRKRSLHSRSFSVRLRSFTSNFITWDAQLPAHPV